MGFGVSGFGFRVSGIGFKVQGVGRWISPSGEAGGECGDAWWLSSSGLPVKRFRGGLVFKAHRLVYHSTLGSRVIKKKKRRVTGGCDATRHPPLLLLTRVNPIV